MWFSNIPALYFSCGNTEVHHHDEGVKFLTPNFGEWTICE